MAPGHARHALSDRLRERSSRKYDLTDEEIERRMDVICGSWAESEDGEIDGGDGMGAVVVTGGSRGFGYALAQAFLEQGVVVVLCGRDTARIESTTASLSMLPGALGRVTGLVCDVYDKVAVQAVWDEATARFGGVDVWVNNAGVRQSGDALWDLDEEDVEHVVRTNLLGVIFGSQVAMTGMLRQGGGQIFNVEGFGSNGRLHRGLNLYGTSKRAVAHFTKALMHEATATPVCVGLLRPGMMVTDLLRDSAGRFPDTEQFRTALRIVGDRPLPVARDMVRRMMANRKNGAHFVWLTPRRIGWRLLQFPFVRRDLGL